MAETEDGEHLQQNVDKHLQEEDIDFRQKTAFCDATFQVGDDKVYASKAVLSIASPVFCEMFEKENKEVITLTDTDVEHFVEFLRYIYPDRKGDLDDTTVYWVLPFAHKYKVKNLMAKCVQMLLAIVREQHSKNANQLYRHIKLSELYDMEDVKKRCVGHASECLLLDMDEAQKVHSILPDTHLLIQRTALRKQERFQILISNFIDRNKMRDNLSDMLEERNYKPQYHFSTPRYKPEDKEMNFMQALCLVFKYLKDERDLKQKALEGVKSILPVDGKNKEIFDFLPEDLKYEIETKN